MDGVLARLQRSHAELQAVLGRAADGEARAVASASAAAPPGGAGSGMRRKRARPRKIGVNIYPRGCREEPPPVSPMPAEMIRAESGILVDVQPPSPAAGRDRENGGGAESPRLFRFNETIDAEAAEAADPPAKVMRRSISLKLSPSRSDANNAASASRDSLGDGYYDGIDGDDESLGYDDAVPVAYVPPRTDLEEAEAAAPSRPRAVWERPAQRAAPREPASPPAEVVLDELREKLGPLYRELRAELSGSGLSLGGDGVA